ncbi:ribonuclease H [Reticulomyxa filosa]|uniref:Ribonuclease H n=1 Tax=Reticulomyxa filosa TaxID=46433 RepID=X6P0E4_RETFI|nr:ribonuclease H [Reticulomyxa filosa]|eukprot:ETO32030.1 ribonuclease H [Reticulomyxa filosa]
MCVEAGEATIGIKTIWKVNKEHKILIEHIYWQRHLQNLLSLQKMLMKNIMKWLKIISDLKWRYLSRGCINEVDAGMPTVEPDPHPMQIAMMTQSNKSPLRSSMNQHQTKFYHHCTFTNPGIGAGLVIQDPYLSQWLKLEYPINGITTNIGSEIEAMGLALKYLSNHYRLHCGRVIIFTDCKFVINSISNKWDSDIYKLPIMNCQKILRSFNEDNAPEIYWIKGHSGIPSNDKVDASRYQCIVFVNETIHYWGSIVETRCQD